MTNLIERKIVNGHSLTWAMDGSIGFSRETFDLLPDYYQNQKNMAKTFAEFERFAAVVNNATSPLTA